ncbi:MAG: MarR family transcriptional regulator, partial [Isosphaeraceae bacterium]
ETLMALPRGVELSDQPLLDLIRRQGPLSIAEMAAAVEVTPTAVRNRLGRLVESGLIERRVDPGGRGRPRYLYQASPEAHKRLGQNYADLAVVLWNEMMHSVEDRELRRLLFGRIIDRLADLYRSQLTGECWEGRMVELGMLLHERGIEVEVVIGGGGTLPILKQHSCPYFELAEVDHAICALERKMFEKVLGRGLCLSQCRLDGDRSCDFEAEPLISPQLPALAT